MLRSQWNRHGKLNSHSYVRTSLTILCFVWLLVMPLSTLTGQTIGSLPFPLFINDQQMEQDIDIIIDDDAGFLITRDVIKKALSSTVNDTILRRIEKLPSSFSYTLLDSIPYMQSVLDEQLLAFFITIDTPGLRVQEISIANTRERRQLAGMIIEPEDVSMYVNLYGSTSADFSFVESSPTLSLPISFTAQPFIHVAGFGVASQLSFTRTDDLATFTMERSQISYMPKGGSIEALVGDIAYATQRFQNDFINTGFVLQNTGDATQSTTRISSYGKEIVLKDPALVRFLVNGSVIYSARLPRGNYQFTNFPFVTGINELITELVDETGKVSRDKDFVGFDTSLIPKGDSEYQLGLGSHDWDLSLPALFGYHRFGLLDQFTMGFAYQAAIERQFLGVDAELASPLGNISLQTGVSMGSDIQFGYTGHISYLYLRPRAGSLSIDATYTSEFFTPFGSVQQQQSTALHVRSSISANVLSLMGLTLQAGLSLPHDSNEQISTQVSLNLSAKLSRHVSVSAESRLVFSDSGPTWSGAFTMSYRPNMNSTYFTTTDLTNGESSASFYASPSSWGGQGTISGTMNGISPADPLPDALQLNGRYQSPLFDTRVTQILTRSQGIPGIATSETMLSIGTALSYTGGYWGISRPITDSFLIAVLDRSIVGDSADIAISIKGSAPARESSLFGTIVIPTINSERENLVQVDILSLPKDFELKHIDYQLSTSSHQGALLRIEPFQLTYASGRLQFKDRVPAKYITGDIYYESEETPLTTVFTDDQGRFYLYDLVPGTYRMTLDRYPDQSFSFSIRTRDSGFRDLKTLSLSVRSDFYSRPQILEDFIRSDEQYTENQSTEDETSPRKVFDSVTLHGKLIFPLGEPVPFANGAIVKTSDRGFTSKFFTTDITGEFMIADLAPGRYRLTFFSLQRFEFDLVVPDEPETPEIHHVYTIDNLFSTTDDQIEEALDTGSAQVSQELLERMYLFAHGDDSWRYQW